MNFKWPVFFAIFLFCQFIHAQTYIGGYTGMAFSKAMEVTEDYYRVTASSYKHKALILGVTVEHKINDKFSVLSSASYSTQKIDSEETLKNGFPWWHISSIKFKYYRLDLALKYAFVNFLYIRLGPSVNLIRTPQINFLNQDVTSSINYSGEDVGIIIATGLEYRRFSFEVGYNRGLKGQPINKETSYFLKPLHSFIFTLGYRIKILKPKNKECKKALDPKIRA